MGEVAAPLEQVRRLQEQGSYRDALSLADSLADQEIDADTAAELAYVRGELCNQLGRLADAERHLLEATLAAARSSADDLAARAWVLLIEVIGYNQQRYEEGMALRHTVEFALTRAGDDPGLRAMLLNNLANVLDAQERYGDALPYHEQALELIEQAREPHHPDVAKLINNLSNSLFFHERYDESIVLDERALDIRKSMFGDRHPEYAKSVANLGGSYHALKRYDEGEALYRQSIDILVATVGEASPILGNSHHNLGELLLDSGRAEEARPHLIRAATIFEGALGADHRHTANALANLERCEAELSSAPRMPECDRYRFLERIGVGGMGEVYRALALGDDGFKKPVAIKRLRPSLARDELFVRRFAEEAKLLVSLQHRNIVTVLDLVRSDADLFISLELVDGLDLRQVRRAGETLSPAMTCYIVGEICRGLAYAHAQGIVHADLSPANVLLSRTGDVKVSDFGIARRAGVVRETIEGKWVYMAPEQARGEALTAKSDGFSVGVVMAELLLGAPPKRIADTQGTKSAQDPIEPSQLDAIAGPLEELCRALLSMRPEDRPSLAQVASALDAIALERGWRGCAGELEALIDDARGVAAVEAATRDSFALLDTEVSVRRDGDARRAPAQ